MAGDWILASTCIKRENYMNNMYSFLMRICLVAIVLVLLVFVGFGCQKKDLEKSSESIEVYRTDRETFHLFLKEPNIELLNSDGTDKCVYSKNGQWHITSDLKRFPIEQSLLDFIGNKSKIEEYLSRNYTNGKVISALIVDSPNVPLTVWVQTDQGDTFITVERHADNNSYVYKCYSLLEYSREYDWIHASLVVNDTEIKSECPSRIYSDYADVPFVIVLNSLGGTIIGRTDETTEISYNGKRYEINIMDTSVFEIGREEINLLHKDGGTVLVYPCANDFMIDSFTLNTVLREMGTPVSITCNKEKEIITISNKTGEGSLS